MAGNITKIYKATGPDGGDVMVVESGGTVEFAESACIEINGVGLTVTADELNILAGVTADADDINKLDGSGDTVASGTTVAEVSDVSVSISDESVSISDISDSATGTEIATAVNALIDTVEGFSTTINSLIDTVETLASACNAGLAAFKGFSIMESS